MNGKIWAKFSGKPERRITFSTHQPKFRHSQYGSNTGPRHARQYCAADLNPAMPSTPVLWHEPVVSYLVTHLAQSWHLVSLTQVTQSNMTNSQKHFPYWRGWQQSCSHVPSHGVFSPQSPLPSLFLSTDVVLLPGLCSGPVVVTAAVLGTALRSTVAVHQTQSA